ncbi:maker361 [Drosophila busckii]|uniref:Maker361 n=1 Tax=Drosophila busckii TaxID=30019 RepID=A0A0M5J8H0_DROBS|nr:uncharacterized protein LOC108605907 [Drosophila busckii]ALC49881.1 maker361 [Drosophila busckii]
MWRSSMTSAFPLSCCSRNLQAGEAGILSAYKFVLRYMKSEVGRGLHFTKSPIYMRHYSKTLVSPEMRMSVCDVLRGCGVHAQRYYASAHAKTPRYCQFASDQRASSSCECRALQQEPASTDIPAVRKLCSLNKSRDTLKTLQERQRAAKNRILRRLSRVRHVAVGKKIIAIEMRKFPEYKIALPSLTPKRQPIIKKHLLLEHSEREDETETKPKSNILLPPKRRRYLTEDNPNHPLSSKTTSALHRVVCSNPTYLASLYNRKFRSQLRNPTLCRYPIYSSAEESPENNNSSTSIFSRRMSPLKSRDPAGDRSKVFKSLRLRSLLLN